MTLVEIRSCTVRVVRRDGWSWGPDPRQLLDGVLAAVPVLIADAVASAVPAGTHGQVTAPVRVRVPISRAQLQAFSRGGLAGSSWPAVRAALEPVLAAALRAELDRADVLRAPSEPDAIAAAPRPSAGSSVLALLLRWHGEGVLADLLSRLPGPVLLSWHDALTQWPASSVTAPDAAGISAALADPPAGLASGPVSDLEGWWRARLAAMAVIAAATGAAAGHPVVLTALNERFGPRPRPAASAPALDAVSASPPAKPMSPGQPAARHAGPEPAEIPARSPSRPRSGAGRTGTRQAGAALPFLILVQLSRIGWLDALAAGVGAAGLTRSWPSLGAALAFTVTDEPREGWRRSREDLATARAFAGVAGPFTETALPDAARWLAPPLDAVLGRCLTAGHRIQDPLLLVPAGADDGLVLFDGGGLFPIAWADDLAGLTPWLEACPGSRLLAHPAIGPIPWAGDDSEPQEQEPPDRTRVDRAGVVLAGLRCRRAFPAGDQPALERSFTLAAGAALASIAWTLWGANDLADPLLTLERLASLDAVVDGGAERVRVVLALGARYFALRQQGLLGEVPLVPWLGGRSVEITGG
jgi:hypothetical protein